MFITNSSFESVEIIFIFRIIFLKSTANEILMKRFGFEITMSRVTKYSQMVNESSETTYVLRINLLRD